MGDFHQFGNVTTMHQLNNRPLEELEAELLEFRKKMPMGLILPSLYSELEGPALSSIVDEITNVPYLDQIVVGLDRADESQFKKALQFSCASMILAHNHPSGDPTPSSEDIKVTKQLISAGEVMGIKVLDHIVIGHRRQTAASDFLSLREAGLVKFG